ncbi:MAG: dTMP kinase [Planctomycetota bacterium]|jgi:dTMP kinase
MSRGRFLVLEGVDGCGKSTQAHLLKERLESHGRRVLHVREPGTTAAGERIRELLLDPALGEIAPITEVFLYQAARAQLVQEVLAPALADGRDIVCERWHYATSAYQGVAGGAGLEAVRTTSELATGGIEPDRAVLLDLPREVAESRLGRLLDRIEQRGHAYRADVADALRDLFATGGDGLRIVPADASPEVVAGRVWEAVRDLF